MGPGPPTPWHTEVDGRRVASSAPVTPATLSMLPTLAARDGSVPRRQPASPGAGVAPVDADGWRTDRFAVVLDRRDPDELVDGDPCFARGRAALFSYRMVDPVIVRGAWWADSPLLGRRIAQEGRFGPLRLRMGAEVVAVVDGRVDVDGRTATVAGFEYRTLAGHLEDGWQSWQLWRWRDTGTLEHHGHTRSRRSDAPGPVIDLGMRVFGRGMQLLASRRSTARLATFVAGPAHGHVVPDGPAPTPASSVRPLSGLPTARLLDGVGASA